MRHRQRMPPCSVHSFHSDLDLDGVDFDHVDFADMDFNDDDDEFAAAEAEGLADIDGSEATSADAGTSESQWI